jgi:hypothetical protein
MNRIRRHRWRSALSLLAMFALVWAQVVLASHPACEIPAMAASPAHAQHAQATEVDELPPCHGAPPNDDLLPCESHCSQGDLGQELPRLLSVPTLGPMPLMPVVNWRHMAPGNHHAAAAHPRVAWHRPTPHPASLLLI